jgi:radical SAM protein with 4Fe4S-binding SPASM domain
MDAKKLLSNKSICVLPWTGFQLEPGGSIKNCVISTEVLGNINKTPIKDILSGSKNIHHKQQMLDDRKPKNCQGCYLQETGRSNMSSISSRLYYLREVGAKTNLDIYDDKKNFKLKHVDLRWTNSCNQACVYCSPSLSSKWAQELGVKVNSEKEARQEVKDFVFENITNLQNVYLAGGEPMLMKENLEFLKLLKEKNPECMIRVNTNLSTTETGIFDLLVSFPNVHWTVSVETTEREYEYIRHHGSWEDFQKNLTTIKKLEHKISFNMLHFILNYKSLFDCVDYFSGLDFHDNSFIIGPLYTPTHLNLLNLPSHMVDEVIKKLHHRLDEKPVGYLKNSYENLIAYFSTTRWDKDIGGFIEQTKIRDNRRGTDCLKVFPRLFEEIDNVKALD